MDLDSIRSHCLKKELVTEGLPFGEDNLVFYVKGKMFALMNLVDLPVQINLKCDPERALELREQYTAITAGYHMNKKHWNTVVVDGTIPAREVYEMIDHSYELVVKGLKKSERKEISLRTRNEPTK